MSKQLLQRFVLASGISIFTVSTIVALISIFPLYNQLKKGEDRNLQFALESRTMTIQEFLSRAKDVTQQITSRTRLREILEDYNNQRVSLEEIIPRQNNILTDALNQSQEMVGIVRLDVNHQLVTQIGLPIPEEFWLIPEADSKNVLISDPIEIDNQFYLVLGASIRNPTSQERVGTDIVLFQAINLQNILANNKGLGQTGITFLGSLNEDVVDLFFLNTSSDDPHVISLQNQIKRIGNKIENGKISSNSSLNSSDIILFRNIPETNWILIIKMNQKELYSNVNDRFFFLGLIILFLSLLGSLGMIVLTRPLTGKLILNTEELEEKIQDKTKALNQKIEEKNSIIQELKETQKQLVQAEKLSGLGQMLSGIAHEINNPINFVSGNINPLEDYSQDILQLISLYQQKASDTDIKNFTEEIDWEFIQVDLPKIIGSIKLGTERVKKIILGLRNFSYLDESQLKQIDIHQEIETTLLILNYRLKHEVEVIKKYGDLPLISCYPTQLNQVFMNLITNGLDAIEDSQVQSKKLVITTAQITDEQVQVKIQDNGSGMPLEIQKKVFNPFFTTKSMGKGTGLGLSICSQIIEKHQGKIEVASQLGEGTEFTITLPIHAKIEE